MQSEWVYNTLDCCVTQEVWDELDKVIPAYVEKPYRFVSGMQAPALLMGVRGLRVDIQARNLWVSKLENRVAILESHLNSMAIAVWGKPLNPRSPLQLSKFFYDCMGLPVQKKYDRVKKQRVPTTDRNALEKLESYFHARPIIQNILRAKDLGKQAATLRTGVDSDGRMRTSYNVCGTDTARWSSNVNPFGTGTNLQNWQDELREIFIPDPNRKFAYIDLEQAESRGVAYLANDPAYIDACESGDLHTTVAIMVWPDKAWSNDAAENKVIAGKKFYRNFSFRDLAKRGGHGTNYMGKPPTMAKHLAVDTKLMEDFQRRYF
ncbi:hypothetical protein KAR91_18405, partial [Candidatus Pacearchaeota archaeon]|nr:hypothetical protein [Candidatus Pacearchaeota archaeon]